MRKPAAGGDPAGDDRCGLALGSDVLGRARGWQTAAGPAPVGRSVVERTVGALDLDERRAIVAVGVVADRAGRVGCAGCVAGRVVGRADQVVGGVERPRPRAS